VPLLASHIHWRLAADVSQVFNLTRLEDAADDTEGVRQRVLSETRVVKRHYYRAENGIAYFLNRRRKSWQFAPLTMVADAVLGVLATAVAPDSETTEHKSSKNPGARQS
jgi:hypothetical protein